MGMIFVKPIQVHVPPQIFKKLTCEKKEEEGISVLSVMKGFIFFMPVTCKTRVQFL
jgi:hypothetical protein